MVGYAKSLRSKERTCKAKGAKSKPKCFAPCPLSLAWSWMSLQKSASNDNSELIIADGHRAAEIIQPNPRPRQESSTTEGLGEHQ